MHARFLAFSFLNSALFTFGTWFAFGTFPAHPLLGQTPSQPTPSQSLLGSSPSMITAPWHIVDPSTLKVVARAHVGQDPHEVIASAAERQGRICFHIWRRSLHHILSVIDLIAQSRCPTSTWELSMVRTGLTFVSGKLWFTAEGAKAIGQYDPATAKIDWIMGTGQNRTHMLYVTADQKQIYTTNVASATVSILEKVQMQMGPPPGMQGGPGGPPPGAPRQGGPGGQPRMDWSQTIIPVGKGDEGFDVSPDSHELWTANAQDGTISVIDISSKKVVATLGAKVNSANRLKFTLDGKHVLISMLGGTDLVIYNASTRTEEKRVKIGHGAAGILMQPDGTRAFISCGPDNYVAVLDLKTLEITDHIDAGGEPDGLAWASQN